MSDTQHTASGAAFPPVGGIEGGPAVNIAGDQYTLSGQFPQATINIHSPTAPPPIRNLHQLPPPPSDFTGRAAELDELAAAIGQRGVAITGLRGLGGIGKTALALKLADGLLDRYPDAQFYLDLRGADPTPLTPAAAMTHIIRAYHGPEARLPDTQAELRGLYCSVLHGQRALLLMDNAAGQTQVEPLLPPASCLLLVTSRRHFVLPGLYSKDLNVLPEGDAQDLLLRIAGRINGHSGEMARLCGYLPLALRVSASALAERKTISVESYLERLQDTGKRLDLIDASLSLSYDLLTPGLQRLWRSLAVFPVAFDLAAAAAVWEIEPDAAAGSLDELARYSLIDWNETTQRFGLHDLARLFAKARLEKDPAGAYTCALAHARHYANVASAADKQITGGDLLAGLARLDAEIEHVRHAIKWAAVQKGNPALQALRDLVTSTSNYAIGVRKMHREYATWLESALIACRALEDKHGEANCIRSLGDVHLMLDEYEAARARYDGALPIFQAIGDRLGEANCIRSLGDVHYYLAEYEAARARYDGALPIYQAIGARLGEANCISSLGNVHRMLAEYEAARARYEQARPIYQAIGDRYSEAATYYYMSRVLYAQGQRADAVALAQTALDTFTQLNVPNAAAIVQEQLDAWRAESGD